MLGHLSWAAMTGALAMAAIQPASAQVTARFEHNGSQMISIAQGDRIVINYDVPRAGLAPFGIAHGTTLFEGRVSPRGLVHGLAYVFSRECPPAPYQVEGIMAKTLVLEGPAPRRGANCVITDLRADTAAARLVFRPVVAAAESASVAVATPSAAGGATAADVPIILDYMPGVGDDISTPMEQALNEALPRHLYLKRMPGDHRELRVAWRVRAPEDDDYPALPNLFGSTTYPSGTVVMAPGVAKADLVIRTVRTNAPDWNRAFEVVLTDARTGQPVLTPERTPFALSFEVSGDLNCKVGRADRCDPSRTIPVDEPGEGEAKFPLQTLLAAFCAVDDISGSECRHMKNYRSGQTCTVKLTGKSYAGKLLASSAGIVVADYMSECESHATEFGGSVVLEQTGKGFSFRGFIPAYRSYDCAVVPATSGDHDSLICIMTHSGYGETETSVREFVLARTSPTAIVISHADITSVSNVEAGENGLVRVSCDGDQGFEKIDLGQLQAGAAAGTVTVELTYADAASVKAACVSAVSGPDHAISLLHGGDGFLPEAAQKRGRVELNLADGRLGGIDDSKPPAQPRPSMAPLDGNPLHYAEQPLISVNDRNFNRYWGDRVNFVAWNAAKPTRLLSATLSLPNGMALTATVLTDRDDCDVDACPLRLFDGNDQIAEIIVCEDTRRHALAAERMELIACGRRHNLVELIDKAKALNRNDPTALLHNDSVVNLVRLGEGNVEIRYLEPRRGLPASMKGRLLFKGAEDKQHRFAGLAYTFKGNCAPAGYNVSGALDENGEIVLSGEAPNWDPKSCRVLGFTTQSPHAKLVFANLPPVD